MEKTFQKYETRGAGYHWAFVARSVRKRNAFVVARYRGIQKKLKGVSSARVLDLGCGDGVLSHLMSRRGAKVAGLDYSRVAVQYAFDRTSGSNRPCFLVGDAYRLPFADGSFDYVVSTEVIEHVAHPDALVSEIRRVLKPEGAAVVSTPVRITERPLDEEHVQEFFPQEFLALFEKAFERAELTFSHPLVWEELQRKRVLGKLRWRHLINLADMLAGINPHDASSGYRYYALQTIVAYPRSNGA